MIKEQAFQAMIKVLGRDHVRRILIDILVEDTIMVEFKKVSGENRVMQCTLNPDMLKNKKHIVDAPKNKNMETIRVFDMGKDDWRSFKLETIKSIQTSF
jgi:hypothetical protein